MRATADGPWGAALTAAQLRGVLQRWAAAAPAIREATGGDRVTREVPR